MSAYHARLAYTTAQWRHCGIWLALEGGGVRYTEAEVIGALAVHPVRAGADKFWRITHIPTGRRISDLRSVQAGRIMAENLSAADLNMTSLRRIRNRVGVIIGA